MGTLQETTEWQRLNACKDNKTWRKWGPYVAERQWGTVREDYSPNGDPWHFISHDMARSNSYRWGEEGIAGYCDARQILCMGAAFWNGKDPIIKERLFGLANSQGNHGEDVKELYFHLESTPTHSYSKFLYKYPQIRFPYDELVKNNQIGKNKPEFEILDTKAFDDSKYFDCFIEYAKNDIDDILMKITVHNRGPESAKIHLLPHIWFRNYWKHNPKYDRPSMHKVDDHMLKLHSDRLGTYYYYHDQGKSLFSENETNNSRVYNAKNDTPYVKDGINDFIISKKRSVNPKNEGSKAAIWKVLEIESESSQVFKARLSIEKLKDPWANFEEIFTSKVEECNEFYDAVIPDDLSTDEFKLAKQAFGGLLWTKQFYYFDVFKWLFGGPGEDPPHRIDRRNIKWQHLTNRNIISLPDKWEYPWYAAWDLAFHCTSFCIIDPAYAKDQLQLMLTESYMHPNGQIPAYEWSFSDVNPPVHSWAVWEVFKKDRELNGKPDYNFLRICFQKLLINFTWWVNQKDKEDQALFEGGFLGLDNIGVFDRNHMPKGIKKMQQADATSWMAMFALNMMRMSVELATQNSAYQESASKFFRHFLNIGWAMNNISDEKISLWDKHDAFYYDVIQLESGFTSRLKVRSLVGIIPLFAVDVIHADYFDQLTEFRKRAQTIIKTRPDLAALISRITEKNSEGQFLFSIMRAYRLEHVLMRLLDENEFLSEYGIRSLSKYHKDNPFVFRHNGDHRIKYVPGESETRMFGGNSNWRGPIWLPINYMIIKSLKEYYKFYGPSYQYEFPTGSGNKLNLKQIAEELTKRLLRLFEKDNKGKYCYHNENPKHHFSKDPYFKDHHLFYEYFHGDNGRGLGASHQTGWTALIANLLLEKD